MRVVRSMVVPLSSVREPRDPIRTSISEEKVREMAESLGAQGQLSPIQVFRVDGGFEVYTGNCRLMAARLLGWESLRAEEVDLEGADPFWGRWHENEKRIEHCPADKVEHAARALALCEGDIEAAARKLGRPVEWVDRWFEVTTWPVEIRRALELEEISWAAARPIAHIGDAELRGRCLRDAVENGYGSRITRAWLSDWQRERAIHEFVGTPVSVEGAVPIAGGNEGQCFFCAGRAPFFALVYRWLHPECARVIEEHRPVAEMGGGVIVGEEAGRG